MTETCVLTGVVSNVFMPFVLMYQTHIVIRQTLKVYHEHVGNFELYVRIF